MQKHDGGSGRKHMLFHVRENKKANINNSNKMKN